MINTKCVSEIKARPSEIMGECLLSNKNDFLKLPLVTFSFQEREKSNRFKKHILKIHDFAMVPIHNSS